jgi:hypothetical protein
MRYVHPAEEQKMEAAKKFENFKAFSAAKLAEKNHVVTTIFRYSAMKTTNMPTRKSLKKLVGAPGFEPGASCAQGRRATRLRYAPT